MILEHALLQVRPGQGAAFEEAILAARPLIAASPGFISIEVRRASEQADLYLLIVGWTDIAAHRDGFRTSDRYAQWRALLHGFYKPMPVIAYFDQNLFAQDPLAQDPLAESIL
ncbi:antibiotic biosynthesis monooxygenase family protein [Sphingomonas alpina]|uniref:Antibiotic biosynthesis monooxygenase n=1 Tax=Sphingomonas alpina TaxID=653931 RepID=A0A7H0LHC3_9SPHN|nr:antibiotic biosynthesis monooxygenase [Sphingomonas alpina]QNQ09076.1 antibiotic biosynthesis monooxygenase [Sphingomonas alpina]